ncbi:hypothetical protein N8J89_38145 [Crossiella sp. CA-258035]|uniref:hypothetical protein n=1 Tax=Crossiella sp. CA-258035 TaxID=2981138 RepID=UPI0024BD1B6D|nr:hypothetical protein [Crossiella sp. CA-258035]WHT18863.1 hypothetical protein N8J89_38145 [Crossiella sp. CA-258035]
MSLGRCPAPRWNPPRRLPPATLSPKPTYTPALTTTQTNATTTATSDGFRIIGGSSPGGPDDVPGDGIPGVPGPKPGGE